VQGVWRPTPGQIRELEAGLGPVLRDALEKRHARGAVTGHEPRAVYLLSHLAPYRRQYAGLVLRGRRIIYVNAAFFPPGEDTTRWRETASLVCDGGDDFFGVEYDPATRRFGEIQFNGSP
jgi:hypothetical protein